MNDDIPDPFDDAPDEHPMLALSKDYETLIRMARRCAYDLSHVVNKVRPGCYFDTPEFRDRVAYWVTYFARGNPGKDYRNELHHHIDELERDVRRLEKELQEKTSRDRTPIAWAVYRRAGDYLITDTHQEAVDASDLEGGGRPIYQLVLGKQL